MFENPRPSVKATAIPRIVALVVLSATTAFAPWPIRPEPAFAQDPPDMVRIIGGAIWVTSPWKPSYLGYIG